MNVEQSAVVVVQEVHPVVQEVQAGQAVVLRVVLAQAVLPVVQALAFLPVAVVPANNIFIRILTCQLPLP